MPINLATDAGLLERLSSAAKRGISVEERRQQRVSFVYGNLPKGSSMTKHEVEQALGHVDRMEGRS